jgi:hypothetical protein
MLINFASGSTPNCTYTLHQEMIPYTCFICINAASRQRVNLSLGFVDINGIDLRQQPNATASAVSCDVNDTSVSCTVSLAGAEPISGINCSVFMDVPRAKSIYESVRCLRSGNGKILDSYLSLCCVMLARAAACHIVKLHGYHLMRFMLFSNTAHCCWLTSSACKLPTP